MQADARLPADANPARHDIVIVGGGLVGASLAIALDGLGLDVAMVEATPPGTLPPVFDERNLSFAAATVNALTALGVMQKLPMPPAPIRRIHVSRSGDFGRVKLDAANYGREAFGQVVVASAFGDALEARLGELRNLTRYRPARFSGVDTAEGDHRTIRVEDVSSSRALRIEARLLVAADGTRSPVRDALGIANDEHDYAQTLLIARVRAQRAPDGTAYERFGNDGPTALLPRGDRHFGVIHGVPRSDADSVLASSDAEWLIRLQSAFGWRVGKLLSSGPRSAYPAIRVVASQTTADRVVLIGNAAQTIHPIGAQGFNLGLRDALTLAELIEARGGDPGDAVLLAAYVERRREDRVRTLAFSDGLARITSNDAPLLRPLRSLGLLAADAVPSAQAMLVGGAMGYRADAPALCREVAR
ncbi:MAG: 2-octaprenyl-6-methoxyphenyl hydroxylase [Pseudomonadota bacterium]|nr:2-octaprenyl-6-methoxyphenyl hydroxylase [Pseudomonadota bacterium]